MANLRLAKVPDNLLSTSRPFSLENAMNSEPPAFSSDIRRSSSSSRRRLERQVRIVLRFSGLCIVTIAVTTEAFLVPLLSQPLLILVQIAVVALLLWMGAMSYLIHLLYKLPKADTKK